MSKSLLRGLKRVSPIRGVGIIALATAVVCLCVAPVAWATNGQEPVGWGQRAVGRGGADVAIGGGPLSMNMNPATLAQLARVVEASVTVGLHPGKNPRRETRGKGCVIMSTGRRSTCTRGVSIGRAGRDGKQDV